MASAETLKYAGIMMKMKTLGKEVELHAMKDSDPEFEDAFGNRDYERLKQLLVKTSKLRDLFNKSFEMIAIFKTNCSAITKKSDEQSDFTRNLGNKAYASAVRTANNPDNCGSVIFL